MDEIDVDFNMPLGYSDYGQAELRRSIGKIRYRSTPNKKSKLPRSRSTVWSNSKGRKDSGKKFMAKVWSFTNLSQYFTRSAPSPTPGTSFGADLPPARDVQSDSNGNVETVETRYGAGSVACRRWDGICEIRLPFGNAYVHELKDSEWIRGDRFRRSIRVQTPYGPGDVVGGRASGMIKVDLSFCIAYIQPRLVKFDVAQNYEVQKVQKPPIIRKNEFNEARNDESKYQHPSPSDEDDQVIVSNHGTGSTTPRVNPVRKARVRSLLNTMLSSKVSLPRKRRSRSMLFGQVNYKKVPKKNLPRSVSVDEKSKSPEEIWMFHAKCLLNCAEEALADEKVYRNLSATVTQVGSLMESLGSDIEKLQRNGIAALDGVKHVVNNFVDKLSNDEAADAALKLLEKSLTSAESFMKGDTKVVSPARNKIIRGQREEKEADAMETEDSSSLHVMERKTKNYREQSHKKFVIPENKIDIKPSYQGAEILHEGQKCIKNLVTAEGTKPAISELFAQLKLGLKKQHENFQTTARKMLDSKTVNALKTSNSTEWLDRARAISKIGISALTGYQDQEEKDAGLRKLSDSELSKLHSELLDAACEIIGRDKSSIEGKEISMTTINALRATLMERIKVQGMSRVSQKCQAIINRASAVLQDNGRCLDWIQTFAKVPLDAKRSLNGNKIFMSSIGEIALNFLRRYLPKIKFPAIEGLTENKECWYRIANFSLKKLMFNKNSVQSKLVGRELSIRVWDLSCDVEKLDFEFKQCRFPFLQAKGSADAQLKGGSLSVTLTLSKNPLMQPAENPEDPPELELFELVRTHMKIDHFDIEVTTGGLWTSWFANTLTWMFASIIKYYVMSQVEYVIDAQIDTLMTKVNKLAWRYRDLFLRQIHGQSSKFRLN